jgi:hypothetical protein
MMDHAMHIKETMTVVCNAIRAAEQGLIDHIGIYYHNADEELITKILYGHIQHNLREASKNRLIEKAFVRDLQKATGNQQYVNSRLANKINKTAAGLVADIVLHNKRTEGTTGGDFGLVIFHPMLKLVGNTLLVEKGQCSGSLCQAKLKNMAGKWNEFTDNQRIALTRNQEFSSLVLYSYSDVFRTILNPLCWTLCRNDSIHNLEEKLRNDAMNGIELLDTTMILNMLSKKEIGTTDKKTIETIIAPGKRFSLELRIHWPGDDHPKEPVQVEVEDVRRLRQPEKAFLYNKI